MILRIARMLIVFVVLGAAAGKAQATVLLDTGVVDPFFANQTDFLERDLYGRFVLGSHYQITSIEGYFIRDREFQFGEEVPVSFRLSLYAGDEFNPPDHPTPGLRHPNLTSLVDFSAFTLPGGVDVSGYYGISGANIDADPGAYWVGLERDGDPRPFAVGAGLAQNPLDQYLYYYDDAGFDGQSPRQFALRVEGFQRVEGSPVPEPLSIYMIGSAMAGLLVLKRKKVLSPRI